MISKVFPGVDTAIEEYATAHADLTWANITGPQLWIIDWEDWGAAPWPRRSAITGART